MKTSNFVAATIAGGIIDFALGYLFYGLLFKEYYPENTMPNIAMIFLGCMMFGFLISYIFVRWASLVTFAAGLRAGAVIGVIFGLMNAFFMSSSTMEVDYKRFAIDVFIYLIMTAIVGGIVAAVNGAMSSTRT